MVEPRKHPDLFDADEAIAYLHLPAGSYRTLQSYRDKGWLVGWPSGRDGALMYHREDLDACALNMVGRGVSQQMHRNKAK